MALAMNVLLLSAATIARGAESYEYTGYVVDNVCWDKPGHIGIDGTNLEKNPGQHILHCLYCCGCPKDGYAVLQKNSISGKYHIKHQLDKTGNTLMEKLARDERTRGGDRPFDVKITVRGALVPSTNIISVSSLLYSPDGKIYCVGECVSTNIATQSRG